LGNKDTRKGKIKMVKNYSALCLYNFVPIWLSKHSGRNPSQANNSPYANQM
jgi:hypothetical protein